MPHASAVGNSRKPEGGRLATSRTSNALRVLIIDDSPPHAGDLRSRLEAMGPPERLRQSNDRRNTTAPKLLIEHARSGEHGHALVERGCDEDQRFALAIIDLKTHAGWDALHTLEHLHRADAKLGVVVVYDRSQQEAEQIRKLAGDDRVLLLSRPVQELELRQAVSVQINRRLENFEHEVALDNLRNRLRNLDAELRHAAHHDELTGLPNRSQLLQRLENQIDRTRREREYKFALLFLDVDRFKVVNDGLGHAVGDMLLVSISDRLHAALRSTDLTSRPGPSYLHARLGGDEFVVLLEDIGAVENAVSVAKRLRDVLMQPFVLQGHEVMANSSVGVVTSDAGIETANEILRAADIAMAHAKRHMPNGYAVYDESMREQARDRIELEQRLRKALESDHFELRHQPIISLRDATLAGFEALVRWQPPGEDIIGPDKFIPIAEETGLIVPMGEFVLRESCRMIRDWRRLSPDTGHLTINVNLSRRQLLQPKIVEDLLRIIEQEEATPEMLKFEVTESLIMQNPDVIVPVLSDFRSAGVQICMDDFGTGYSSLSCLYQFPIDVLKIDRAFIKDLSQDRDFTAVVQAIVTLAHNLDIIVVAEGVEQPEQLVQLQALECDLGQGYYFARPLEAEAAAKMITDPPKLARSA